MKSTKKQILSGLAVGVSLVAMFAVSKYWQVSKAIAEGAKFAPPPDAITTYTAKRENWSKTLNAIGSLAPNQGITLSAEVAGKVVKINFSNGALVKQGEVLLELDTSVEEANLAAALAKEDWGRKAYTRAQTLLPKNAISQDVFDNTRSQFEQSQAEVRSLRAVIAKKKIAAPFSGRAGIRRVNIGQFVSPGTELVPLQAFDPMFLNFSLPEQDISKISNGQTVEFRVDAYPEQVFKASISSVNPLIDPNSRNFELQATVENSQELLKAGMFAKVSVQLKEELSAIVLPSTSVKYAPYGNLVFVVVKTKDQDGKELTTVQQNFVKVGPRKGDQVAILSGIEEGVEVATSGLFKLRQGAAVQINNSVQPANSPNPKPEDT